MKIPAHGFFETGLECLLRTPTQFRCDPRGVATWDTLTTAFARSCETLGATAAIADPLTPETEAEPAPHRLHDSILPWVEEADAVLTHWPGDVNQVHRGVAREHLTKHAAQRGQPGARSAACDDDRNGALADLSDVMR